MNDFKGRHYQGLIILGCVRWYCKYGISYRDLEEMMLERGVEVDHTTLYRWIQYYAPLLEKKLRSYFWPSFSSSWRVDETYIRVKGKWAYLYRAVDKTAEPLISTYQPLAMLRQPSASWERLLRISQRDLIPMPSTQTKPRRTAGRSPC